MKSLADMLEHSDIPLTIATAILAWATVHLWSERERAKTRARYATLLIPWHRRTTRSISWSEPNGTQFHEVDTTDVDEGGESHG